MSPKGKLQCPPLSRHVPPPPAHTHIALLYRSLDTETHTPLRPEFPRTVARWPLDSQYSKMCSAPLPPHVMCLRAEMLRIIGDWTHRIESEDRASQGHKHQCPPLSPEAKLLVWTPNVPPPNHLVADLYVSICVDDLPN